MKRLVLTLTLASLAAPLASVPAAPRRVRECPAVVVSCPDTGLVRESVTFTAAVSGADASVKLTYNWTVSAGSIESGQGTNSIVVDTTGLPRYSGLTATVEVAGFPEACPKSSSCTTGLLEIKGIYHDRIDEYGDIKFEDEQARLDNFAIELQNWREGVGYVVAYGGRRARRGEARRRAERAKKYMTTVRHIPAAQIVTIDGGYREELTVELKLRSKDVPPPVPTPTVDQNEVIFDKPAPKRRTRIRR